MHVPTNHAIKHRNQREAGLGASKPRAKWIGEARAFGARFANPCRSLAGGEKAVCATFWSRSTARTRRDTEVHLSHFFIPMLWAIQNTNYLRNRRHSIFFDSVRTRGDETAPPATFLIGTLSPIQNTNSLRNRRHSIFFDVWG